MIHEEEFLSNPATTKAADSRTRFRVPLPFFVELVREVKAGRW